MVEMNAGAREYALARILSLCCRVFAHKAVTIDFGRFVSDGGKCRHACKQTNNSMIGLLVHS